MNEIKITTRMEVHITSVAVTRTLNHCITTVGQTAGPSPSSMTDGSVNRGRFHFQHHLVQYSSSSGMGGWIGGKVTGCITKWMFEEDDCRWLDLWLNGFLKKMTWGGMQAGNKCFWKVLMHCSAHVASQYWFVPCWMVKLLVHRTVCGWVKHLGGCGT